MRIVRIQVTGLFDTFDHDVPLNAEDRITIMHGPNGFGKTVLLSMINALFHFRLSELRRAPFSALSIHFQDGHRLDVKRPTARTSREGGEQTTSQSGLVFEYRKGRGRAKTYEHHFAPRRHRYTPLAMIEPITGLQRIGVQRWLDRSTGQKLDYEAVMELFGDVLPAAHGASRPPQWLREVTSSIPVHFVEAQRLLSFAESEDVEERKRPTPVPVVEKYAKELAEAMQSKLAEYATLSQSLDRTFPTRLVQGNLTANPTLDHLRARLSELEEKRTRLMAAGLLDKEAEIDFGELQKIDESNRNVLSVYVQDVTKKLAVFDALTNKIDLLAKTINSRFLFKRMAISRTEGFVFQTPAGKPLVARNLSSGEQHELVLLYELLFRVARNSLVLVDEPELSLHVVWQQQFLRDLQEITRLGGFDVVIATHSPQIIHDRWDLTVELKGPANVAAP